MIVATQEVRNFFLIGAFANPEIEIPDISYCILERVGRSRRCGELSVGLNFLRNGANPTFYFWNKLKNHKLITSQVDAFRRLSLMIRGSKILNDFFLFSPYTLAENCRMLRYFIYQDILEITLVKL